MIANTNKANLIWSVVYNPNAGSFLHHSKEA